MNVNSQRLRFEDLPNEIFLYGIFPFFSWDELYNLFFGLNTRINKILQSITKLDFTVDSLTEKHPALQFFTPCITCLNVCLGQFDIAPFVALRSLTLQYPSLQQRNSIRPENFPNLTRLSLSYPLEDAILLNLIFSNAFEHLNICKFDRTFTNHRWKMSPKIHSLSISVYDSYGIVCVLHACPNLFRLNIIVYDTPQSNLVLPNYSITCTNLLLQYLFIRSEFNILISILKLMPNLKWLAFDDIKFNVDEVKTKTSLKLLSDVLLTIHHLSYLCLGIVIREWNEYDTLKTWHPLFKSINITDQVEFLLYPVYLVNIRYLLQSVLSLGFFLIAFIGLYYFNVCLFFVKTVIHESFFFKLM